MSCLHTVNAVGGLNGRDSLVTSFELIKEAVTDEDVLQSITMTDLFLITVGPAADGRANAALAV